MAGRPRQLAVCDLPLSFAHCDKFRGLVNMTSWCERSGLVKLQVALWSSLEGVVHCDPNPLHWVSMDRITPPSSLSGET